jgi:flagellar M-ring protein FliF
VHLALSKPSPFLREQPKNSASVLVNLHPGRTLEPMQVAAITHLVSNSVPGLPVKNITVVDQNGTLLSGEAESGGKGALDPGQLKYRHDLEQNYAQRIEAILLPVVGAGNARAQVAAEIDFTETEQAEEIYKPNQKPEDAAVRSQQTSESSGGGQQAGGVPGALTNQAPAPATAPVTAPAGQPAATAAATAAANSRREATVNYEVDKTIRHTRQAMGRIKKLSVAVVVNHNQVRDAKGKVTARPLSEAQKKQITELVRGVIGFNEERGDSVSVVNSPFKKPEVEDVPEVPVWKQPQTVELVKDAGKHLLIGALALYLLLGIVRPMLRNLTQPPVLPAPDLLTAESGGAPSSAAAVSYTSTLENAKQIARQDPKVVANVVKSWVGSNE